MSPRGLPRLKKGPPRNCPRCGRLVEFRSKSPAPHRCLHGAQCSPFDSVRACPKCKTGEPSPRQVNDPAFGEKLHSAFRAHVRDFSPAVRVALAAGIGLAMGDGPGRAFQTRVLLEELPAFLAPAPPELPPPEVAEAEQRILLYERSVFREALLAIDRRLPIGTFRVFGWYPGNFTRTELNSLTVVLCAVLRDYLNNLPVDSDVALSLAALAARALDQHWSATHP